MAGGGEQHAVERGHAGRAELRLGKLGEEVEAIGGFALPMQRERERDGVGGVGRITVEELLGEQLGVGEFRVEEEAERGGEEFHGGVERVAFEKLIGRVGERGGVGLAGEHGAGVFPLAGAGEQDGVADGDGGRGGLRGSEPGEQGEAVGGFALAMEGIGVVGGVEGVARVAGVEVFEGAEFIHLREGAVNHLAFLGQEFCFRGQGEIRAGFVELTVGGEDGAVIGGDRGSAELGRAELLEDGQRGGVLVLAMEREGVGGDERGVGGAVLVEFLAEAVGHAGFQIQQEVQQREIVFEGRIAGVQFEQAFERALHSRSVAAAFIEVVQNLRGCGCAGVAVGEQPPRVLGLAPPAKFDREIGQHFEALGALAGARDGVLPDGFDARVERRRLVLVQRAGLIGDAQKIPFLPFGAGHEGLESGPVLERDERLGEGEAHGHGRGAGGRQLRRPRDGLGGELTGVEPLDHGGERGGVRHGFFLQTAEQRGEARRVGETRHGEAEEHVGEFGGGMRLQLGGDGAGTVQILAAQGVGEEDVQGGNLLRAGGAHAVERGVGLQDLVGLRGEQLRLGEVQLQRFVLRRGGQGGGPVRFGLVVATVGKVQHAGDFVELQRVPRLGGEAFGGGAGGGEVVEADRGVGPALEVFDTAGFEQRHARAPEDRVGGAEHFGDFRHHPRGGDVEFVELERATGGDVGVGIFLFLQKRLGLGDDLGLPPVAIERAAFPLEQPGTQAEDDEHHDRAEGPIRPQRRRRGPEGRRGNGGRTATGYGGFGHSDKIQAPTLRSGGQKASVARAGASARCPPGARLCRRPAAAATIY